jgi:hypothetical protein
MIGKSRYPHVMMDMLFFGLQTHRPRQQLSLAVGFRARFAQRRPAFHAGHAMTAARHEDQHHQIAGPQVGHAGADFHHFARCFMPERHRHWPRTHAGDDRQVGMAQPGGAHPDQYFARPRRLQIEFFDLQRLALCKRLHGGHFTQYGGLDFHVLLLVRSRVRHRPAFPVRSGNATHRWPEIRQHWRCQYLRTCGPMES